MSCCGSEEKACNGKQDDATFDLVKNYYGKVLQSTKDLKTSACTAAGRPHERVVQLIRKVPKEGHMEYLDRAGIADQSIDIIISNCVINLSPDKPGCFGKHTGS
eukprot:jgi/Pico_ML_1/55008/g766.t1